MKKIGKRVVRVRKREHRLSVLMVSGVIVVLAVMLSVASISLHAKNQKYKKQEAELEKQLEQEAIKAEENEELEEYNIRLTAEEQNIIATYMIVEWLSQQLASIENTRMKYSGSDFKFTSQANHMAKLQSMKKDYERMGFHLQRLYKRRKADANGVMRSTFGSIMEPVESTTTSTNNQTPSTPGHDCNDIWADLDQNQDGIVDRANVSSEIEMIEF